MVVLVLEHLRVPPAELRLLVLPIAVRVVDPNRVRTRHERNVPSPNERGARIPGITQARLKLAHHLPRARLNARIKVGQEREVEMLLGSVLR